MVFVHFFVEEELNRKERKERKEREGRREMD